MFSCRKLKYLLKTPLEPKLHALQMQEEAINFSLQKLRAAIGYRDHQNILFIDRTMAWPVADEPVVNIVIPAIDKDRAALPYTIQSLRKNLAAKVDRVLVVSTPQSPSVKGIAADMGAEFVLEQDFLGPSGITKDRIERTLQARRIPRHHSTGWLLQQFIKLAGFSGDTDFFVIDADTVLTKRYAIKCDGRPVFREWDWREFHYCTNYRGLSGIWPVTYFTTVHHMMFFDGAYLREMKAFLEDRYACDWVDAILNNIPNDDFSEYTLFSQWALGNKECYLADVNQKNEFRVEFARFKSLEDIERAYSHVDAVSFHNLNL